MKTKFVVRISLVVLFFYTQIFAQNQLVSIKKPFSGNSMNRQSFQIATLKNLSGTSGIIQKKEIDRAKYVIEKCSEANYQLIPTFPFSGEIVKTNSPRLSWIVPVTSKDMIYELEYSTDNDFENVISIKSLTTNEIILDNLEPATKYFWRVRSIDGDNNILYSRIESFETPMSSVEFLNDGLSKGF